MTYETYGGQRTFRAAKAGPPAIGIKMEGGCVARRK